MVIREQRAGSRAEPVLCKRRAEINLRFAFIKKVKQLLKPTKN
jgi:hypothetical protein